MPGGHCRGQCWESVVTYNAGRVYAPNRSNNNKNNNNNNNNNDNINNHNNDNNNNNNNDNKHGPLC